MAIRKPIVTVASPTNDTQQKFEADESFRSLGEAVEGDQSPAPCKVITRRFPTYLCHMLPMMPLGAYWSSMLERRAWVEASSELRFWWFRFLNVGDAPPAALPEACEVCSGSC